VRDRRPRGRRKSSASLVEGKASRTGKSVIASRRWRGSGLGEPRRIGQTRTAKGASRYRARIATGKSEARWHDGRGFGRTRPHGTSAIRRSDQCVVKRTVLWSRWVATHRVHVRRRVGYDEPEAGRVRVLVDRVLGSRNGSDASRSRSLEWSQGHPRVRDLA